MKRHLPIVLGAVLSFLADVRAQEVSVDPCCPVDGARLVEVISVVPAGGLSGPYSLAFQSPSTASANTSFNALLKAYLQYLNVATNGAIENIQIHFELLDSGADMANPTPGASVSGSSYNWVWTPNDEPFGGGFFPGTNLQVNHWYTIVAEIGAFSTYQGPEGKDEKKEEIFSEDCSKQSLDLGIWTVERTRSGAVRSRDVPVLLFRCCPDATGTEEIIERRGGIPSGGRPSILKPDTRN